MSERDSDFEFDFFEEPATREAQPRERTLRRPLGGPRGPRGPRRPMRPAAGFTPLLRLVGLIAFAILIVVLLVLWAQSCQEAERQDAYREYITSVVAVGDDSQRIGRDLNGALTTQGITPAELQTQLAGLANRQRLNLNRARGIEAPGPLRDEHAAAVQALQFRVNGVTGLAAAFRRTAGSQDAQAAGTLLASQAQRLVASDVLWEDLYMAPAREELRAQDVTGVEVRDSNFVQNPEFASPAAMVQIWERIRGGAAGGGGGTDSGGPLHGTNIQAVRVQPSGQQLSAGTETPIVASTDLAFEVVVENSGDNQEVSIDVTLTIQSPNPVEKTQTIDLINPGETVTLTFRNFPALEFGTPQTLRVDVAPVPDEANTGNNTAEYQVSFSVE